MLISRPVVVFADELHRAARSPNSDGVPSTALGGRRVHPLILPCLKLGLSATDCRDLCKSTWPWGLTAHVNGVRLVWKPQTSVCRQYPVLEWMLQGAAVHKGDEQQPNKKGDVGTRRCSQECTARAPSPSVPGDLARSPGTGSAHVTTREVAAENAGGVAWSPFRSEVERALSPTMETLERSIEQTLKRSSEQVAGTSRECLVERPLESACSMQPVQAPCLGVALAGPPGTPPYILREDSEWSIVSSWGTATVESIELSEDVEASDNERPRSSADRGQTPAP